LGVEKLPPDAIVNKLKAYGFSGILIYRGQNLSDRQKVAAKQLADFLFQNGYPNFKSSAGDFEFFGFEPDSQYVFPPAQPMFVNNWWGSEIQASNSPVVEEGVESVWRWATQSTALAEIFNEQSSPRRLVLRGKVVGAMDSGFQILVKGKSVYSGKISSNTPVEFSTDAIEVVGQKAVRFEFKSDQKPVVREGRKFSFAVCELEAMWE
jgi:hypothetical protein